MGVGVGVWARGQTVGQLYGVQVVAVIGGLVLCSTNAWAAENPAIGTTIAIPLLAGAFVLLRRLVPLAAYGWAGWPVSPGWCCSGWAWTACWRRPGSASGGPTSAGWPLLVAALFAAVVVHLPGVRDELRSVAAGLTLVPLVLLANGPDTIGTDTRDLLLVCATLRGPRAGHRVRAAGLGARGRRAHRARRDPAGPAARRGSLARTGGPEQRRLDAEGPLPDHAGAAQLRGRP